MKPKPFWNYVQIDAPDKCWIWNGGRKVNIYGRFTYGNAWRNGTHASAHRVAWELTYGPVPKGLLVLHKCDNPPCVNPNHLFLGTYKDNSQDCKQKGRLPDHKGELHPMARLSEADVLEIRESAAREPQRAQDIAVRYGVDAVHITRILLGKSWKHVGGPIKRREKQIFSDEQILAMLKMKHHGMSQSAIAERFKTNQSCISRIVNGHSHTHVVKRVKV